MTIQVRFHNVDKVMRDIGPDEFARRAKRGFHAAGTVIEAEAKTIVRPHHFTGRFERGIHTVTTGDTLGSIVTRVGVSAGAVPEARPLTYGWPIGKMPSISGLIPWVEKKFGKGDAARIAYFVAVKIMRKGFSFGKLDTFTEGYSRNREKVKHTIARFMANHSARF